MQYHTIMVGQKIDGIEVSNAVKDILKNAVEKLNSENTVPCLATVLVGDDPRIRNICKK